MKLFDKANDALKLVQDSLNTLLSRQTELTQQIGQRNIDIKALQNMPMSIDDFCSFIPHFVKSEGEKLYGGILRANLSDGHSKDSRNKLAWGSCEDETGEISLGYHFISMASGNGVGDSDVIAFRMLCFYSPEVVIEKLANKLKSDLGKEWGNTKHPAIAERRVQVVKLREERQALEAELEEVNNEIDRINRIVEAIPKPPVTSEPPEEGVFIADNGMRTTISKDIHGNKFSTIG